MCKNCTLANLDWMKASTIHIWIGKWRWKAFLALSAPPATKSTGPGSNRRNHGRRLSAQARSSSVAVRSSSSRWNEISTVEHKVTLRSPVPALPPALSRIHSLRHLITRKLNQIKVEQITTCLDPLFSRQGNFYYLLCERIERGQIPVALAVDCGLRTSANGIHLPMRVVVVNDMEVSVSAPGNLHILC